MIEEIRLGCHYFGMSFKPYLGNVGWIQSSSLKLWNELHGCMTLSRSIQRFWASVHEQRKLKNPWRSRKISEGHIYVSPHTFELYWHEYFSSSCPCIHAEALLPVDPIPLKTPFWSCSNSPQGGKDFQGDADALQTSICIIVWAGDLGVRAISRTKVTLERQSMECSLI